MSDKQHQRIVAMCDGPKFQAIDDVCADLAYGIAGTETTDHRRHLG